MTATSRLRIPAVLTLATAVLAAIAALPTALIGGSEALAMMGVGAVASLVTVLGGYWIAQLAFRGPDRFATKLLVGGFVTRMFLLFGVVAMLVLAAKLPITAFMLWLVGFYFALILVEAWLLSRPAAGSES
jgi:hypothetical protein